MLLPDASRQRERSSFGRMLTAYALGVIFSARVDALMFASKMLWSSVDIRNRACVGISSTANKSVTLYARRRTGLILPKTKLLSGADSHICATDQIL